MTMEIAAATGAGNADPESARDPDREPHLDPAGPAWTAGGLSTDRIKAFSDGVFAFAITLLVLTIKVPEITPPHNISLTADPQVAQKLAQQLSDLGPTVLTYVLSFVVIGIYWVGHHVMLHYIKRSNRTFLWINITLLLCIAFIPFPTALLGQYWQYQIAVIIYGATLIATNLVLQTLWWYATSDHRLVDTDIDPRLVRMGTRRNLTAPALYLCAIGLSFVHPVLSLAVYVLVPTFYIRPSRLELQRLRRRRGSRKAASPTR